MLAEISGRKGLNVQPPPYDNSFDDEVYCVLDGQLTCFVGDRQLTVRAGSAAFLPRNVRRSFRIDSEHVSFLLLTMPPDFGGVLHVPSIPPVDMPLPPAAVATLKPPVVAALSAQYRYNFDSGS